MNTWSLDFDRPKKKEEKVSQAKYLMNAEFQ